MADDDLKLNWYCVRAVFAFGGKRQTTYEERLTLWQALDFAVAVELAEDEARSYADSLAGCSFTGLAQAYQLYDAPGHGTEVFSLMRDSTLRADEYLTAFFDTGSERQDGTPSTDPPPKAADDRV